MVEQTDGFFLRLLQRLENNLDSFRGRLQDRHVKMEITEAARRFIAESEYDPVSGLWCASTAQIYSKRAGNQNRPGLDRRRCPRRLRDPGRS